MGRRRVRLFGTDGVRGRMGVEPCTWPSMARLAVAVASELHARSASRVCIGRDTRLSGSALSQLWAAAFSAMGIEVVDVGVVPTGVLAWLTVHLECCSGVMVTASHNPPQDNGIKLIDASGRKWDKDAERAVMVRWHEGGDVLWAPSGAIVSSKHAYRKYIDHLCARFPGDVSGVKVCVDLAHGAGVYLIPELLNRLGCEVYAEHARPEGAYINQQAACFDGAILAERVRFYGADVGFAFDGDADRVVVCDAEGSIWDGDALLHLMLQMDQASGIAHEGIVVTHMSNQSLIEACAAQSVQVLRVDVGDREVSRVLAERGWTLGGEPCGHLIDASVSWVSDPCSVMMRVLGWIKQYGGLSHAERLKPYPHILRSFPLQTLDIEAVYEHMASYDPDIRWVIRCSGTEPVVRVMGEGRDLARVTEAFQVLVSYVGLPY